MNKNDFAFLVLLAVVVVFGFYKVQDRQDVVVYPTTQPAVESPIVLPTWTPLYSSPTPQAAEFRGGFVAPTPPGNVGTHNPGRSDKRTP